MADLETLKTNVLDVHYAMTADLKARMDVAAVQLTTLMDAAIGEDTLPGNTAPVGNAGLDITVASDSDVTVLASAMDAENDTLTFDWEQISGPAVSFADAQTLAFRAPALAVTDAPALLEFGLVVKDDQGAVSVLDTVVVTVTPPSAPPPPPVTGLRAHIEGLFGTTPADRKTPNGVMDRSRLKVVGSDPLPKGATFTASTVTVNGATLDGWDLGGRGLNITGKASLTNIFSEDIKGPKQGGPLYPVQISINGDLEWAEFLELHGLYGKGAGPSKVLAAQGARVGQPWTHGKLRMLRRSRFEGWPQDHLFTYGVPGGVEMIEENYFGPQWAVPGTAPHADVMTMGGLAGLVHWKRNYIDHSADGNAIGINNIFRLVPNKIDQYNRGDIPFEAFLAEENLCLYPSLNRSVPVHIARGGQTNWGVSGQPPRFDFVGNWMMPGKSGLLFYQGSASQVTTWDRNVHAGNGTLLARA